MGLAPFIDGIDDRLSLGYNGTIHGKLACKDGHCQRCASGAAQNTRMEECLCQHAEDMAIKLAGSCTGATIYVTISPCASCTKKIIDAGIKRVVYDELYEGYAENNLKMQTNGVETIRLEEFEL